MSVLELEHLTVTYGKSRHRMTAVDSVDLQIPEGAIVGLVGESAPASPPSRVQSSAWLRLPRDASCSMATT